MNAKKYIGLIVLLGIAGTFVLSQNKQPLSPPPAPPITSPPPVVSVEPVATIALPRSMPVEFQKQHAHEIMVAAKKMSDPLIKEGLRHLENKEFDAAIKIFREMIATTPINPHPYYLLAILYSKLGNAPEAYRVMEQATEMKISFDLIFSEFIQAAGKNPPPETLPSEKAWIAPFKDNKTSAITFSFDDGPSSFYSHGIPLMDKYGYKATININPGSIINRPHETMGTWEQWRDASRRGFEIGNHTMNHTILLGQPEELLEYEVNESFDLIAKEISRPPASFVFPRGRGYFDHNGMKKVLERHAAVIDADFLARVAPRVFMPTFGGDSFSIQTARQIVDYAVENKLWLIAQCHALKVGPWSYFRPLTTEFFAQFLAYINQHENKIYVDTFINVYRYLYARNATQVIIENNKVNALTFHLQNNITAALFAPTLTVVVNPAAEKLHMVWARQNNKPLNTRIREGLILIDVAANETAPVLVEWK